MRILCICIINVHPQFFPLNLPNNPQNNTILISCPLFFPFSFPLSLHPSFTTPVPPFSFSSWLVFIPGNYRLSYFHTIPYSHLMELFFCVFVFQVYWKAQLTRQPWHWLLWVPASWPWCVATRCPVHLLWRSLCMCLNTSLQMVRAQHWNNPKVVVFLYPIGLSPCMVQPQNSLIYNMGTKRSPWL